MVSNDLRHYSFTDQFIEQFDQGLRALFNVATSERSNPAAQIKNQPLTKKEEKHSAGLLRVDHTGEICAQALYQAQALTAASPVIKEKMQQSAVEEIDHLVWCKERLEELQSRPSYFNFMWYFLTFFLGALAGKLGDNWSLGFVVETENQVTQHLEKHLTELPKADEKSRAILMQMRDDEAHHATVALENGAQDLPFFVKQCMRLMAKLMTTTAYYW